MNYELKSTGQYDKWFHGTTVVLLLAGGDKSTQQKDIRAAKNMLKEMEE
ncbi:MAG: hypothetical protein PHG14_03960 [Desulfobacter postgatei]|nr:hypothetical protein [Desulfobacter postgatei]MDD4272866.1 hypothetical protein [Desulfobacter postgatei]